jgi:CheY-like chemotaxis protein
MVTPPGILRLLLRAEVEHRGLVKVTNTIEISDSALVVRMDDPPPIGARVHVRLSFPRLISPMAFDAKVVGHHPGQRPGDPPAMVLEFEEEAQRRDARNLLKRVNSSVAAAAPKPAATPVYRVLLVEDNEMIRDMFSYGVRKHFAALESRAHIDLASDGVKAWEMLASADYDLVLVDFYLPGLDGSQLVSRMRRDERLSGLPVVGISIGGEDARAAMIKAGADLFLDKPIVLRDLLSTLEKLTAPGARA